jgi:hypothetical protein
MCHKNTKWKWTIDSTKQNETKLKSKHTTLKKPEIKTPKYASLYNIIMHQCLYGCNHKNKKSTNITNNTMQLPCECVAWTMNGEHVSWTFVSRIKKQQHNLHKKIHGIEESMMLEQSQGTCSYNAKQKAMQS